MHRMVGEVVKDTAICSGGLGLDSRTQVATAALFLRSCVAQTLSHGDVSATPSTFRCNTASIMKIFCEVMCLIVNEICHERTFMTSKHFS